MIKQIVIGLILGVMVSGCGRDGAQGIQGSAGSNGQTIVGAAGAQGVPGTPGTSITVIKFCPGATVYPSKFVEVGFCIGGKLYAVYSQNGGFESEIPPGSYGSNGINASCNFSVLPSCGIQN